MDSQQKLNKSLNTEEAESSGTTTEKNPNIVQIGSFVKHNNIQVKDANDKDRMYTGLASDFTPSHSDVSEDDTFMEYVKLVFFASTHPHQ